MSITCTTTTMTISDATKMVRLSRLANIRTWIQTTNILHAATFILQGAMATIFVRPLDRDTVKTFFRLKNFFFSHFVSWRERFERVMFVPYEYFSVHKNARPKTDPIFFWPCGRDHFRANTCRKCAARGESTLFANSRTPERFPNNLDMASIPRCFSWPKTLILFVQGLFCT